MKPSEVFDDVQRKFSDLVKQSPIEDVQRNLRTAMTQGFAKLDLVTREEFDVQTQVLARTRERLEALERKVAELEARLGGTPQ